MGQSKQTTTYFEANIALMNQKTNMNEGDFCIVGAIGSTTFSVYQYNGLIWTGDKLEKALSGQTLPTGVNSLYDLLVIMGLSTTTNINTAIGTTGNAIYDALATASKDDLVEILKHLITKKLDTTLPTNKTLVGGSGNIAEYADVIPEWGVGASSPGQKENKGLIIEMVADGSAIVAVPNIIRKVVDLKTIGQITILNDSYAGAFYVFKSATIVGRGIGGVSAFPTVSLGNNVTFNNIVASTTLNTLATGSNILSLLVGSTNSTIEATTPVILNVTGAMIGAGTCKLVLEGYLC